MTRLALKFQKSGKEERDRARLILREEKLAEYTVVVGTARGAFDDIEEAKSEARRLWALNCPDPVSILDGYGELIFEIRETTEDCDDT